MVGKEAQGSFQGKFIGPKEEVGREGNSFCVELYGSVEGWYLSRKETGLEGKKKSWERNDFSPAVKLALSYALTLKTDICSVSFPGLVSRTTCASGRQVRERRVGGICGNIS